MESKINPASIPSAEDLIEARKPTSLLIAQFFLFPLIIIAICVGIFLLFGYATYQQKTPREYLNEIRSGSDTQRWQAAFELSNVITNQKDKIRDTDFVKDVTAEYQASVAKAMKAQQAKAAGAPNAATTEEQDDPRVRRFLALTMGHLGDKRAVPALLDGLGDADVENQVYSLWALGSIGDNAAVPGILKELQNTDPAVRKVAAYVLGVIKDPAATHDLQVALNDASDEVRWNAAMSLALMNDGSGSAELTKLIDRSYLNTVQNMTPEQKNELMANAVKCLGILKFQPERDRIQALSEHDPDLGVRSAALEALKKF